MKLKCHKCLLEKPVEAFSKQNSRKRGYSYVCKECHNTYSREVWYKNNSSKQKAASKSWKQRNRAKYLARSYGVPEEDMQHLLDVSDGMCEICKKELIVPNVDHDHKTGKLRGVLCADCNRGLGLFRDNVASLRRAADYIEAHIQVNAVGR